MSASVSAQLSSPVTAVIFQLNESNWISALLMSNRKIIDINSPIQNETKTHPPESQRPLIDNWWLNAWSWWLLWIHWTACWFHFNLIHTLRHRTNIIMLFLYVLGEISLFYYNNQISFFLYVYVPLILL